MPWTPCSCSLQHTLLYFSFLKLPEKVNFRQQNRLLAILVKHHRSRRFTRTDLSCSDLLSVCLSIRVSFYALLLYTHNRPVIKCSTEYRKPERSLRRGARSKIRSLLQKDSTRRGHLKVREREIYLREKSSSFTAAVIVISWAHLLCDGRARTPTCERAGAGKTTARNTALDVPGRNSRLLPAILLLLEFSTTYLTFWHRKFHPLLSFT
jgi:hypothetical protein